MGVMHPRSRGAASPDGRIGDLWIHRRRSRAGEERARTPYPEGVDSYVAAVIWSLLPTVVVSVIFFFVFRNILRMDRTERKAYARIEAEERAKRGLDPVVPPAADR